ncbi:efflux RND transporter periplasmic adaptor subunit [Leptothoe spongobia]|uniref:Efflux RND transporter periplasmic adaptor subunit n=1 Tax=Leptothoe spongobia TAU-MAC 1115 TaxID=1967444 RepID=A0A947DDZ3_9CYAN|nr:efflux RND transporter periplasmic adaptor subunit [Leptothoe spongobia]MBT9315293.1 efflux RND transporter periplasmic adaptor subunit [Leptothoe spongobia TAU-MAC 1115]
MTRWSKALRYSIRLIAGLGLVLWMPSCGFFAPSGAQTERSGRSDASDQPIAVETARAQIGTLTEIVEYSGTTRPQQQIALRAQTAGEVVDVGVDVGDLVAQGQILARIDGGLLTARVNEAQAELSVRQSEVAEDEVAIADAQATAAQATATRDQAKIDADRLRKLANQGAISQQAAEAAELALVNAEQSVKATQAQVNARQQVIAAAASRVNAQQALVDEAQEQLAWVNLRSQLPATVLNRLVDPGDYVQVGATLLELGDLSTLKVMAQVSELELGQLTIGQPAQIRLDAFPDIETISGRITRISPIADATSRLVTVEVTIANPDGRIGSGLLARVRFKPPGDEHIVVPTSALENGPDKNTIFVIEQDHQKTTAVARSVRIGQNHQEQIEILSGLEINEPFVVQSDRPLKTGQAVRLSILSEGEAE